MVVEVGFVRQCVEVLIRLVSRWGAWRPGQSGQLNTNHIQPQGRGGGRGDDEEDSGVSHPLHPQECDYQNIRWAGTGIHELIQQNFVDNPRTILLS